MCFLGQRGRTSGTLCAHQEWYFGGEWSALGKSKLLYSWFEPILTTVYTNIPNCKWSASYGCLPEDEALKLLDAFLWCPPLDSTRLTDGIVPVLNNESEPSFALVCRMMLTICSGSAARVGKFLRNGQLYEIRDKRRPHTALRPTLASKPCHRQPWERGSRGQTHAATVSCRQKSRSRQTWSQISLRPRVFTISFCPVTTPRSGCPCSLPSWSPNR